jgi:two-component system, LytTR family, sensor kinase
MAAAGFAPRGRISDYAGMQLLPISRTRDRFSDWPLALKSILGFWAVYYLTVVARAFLGYDPATVLQNRAIAVGAGALITGALYAGIRFFAPDASMVRKMVVATIGSFLAAAALASFQIAADRYQEKPQDEFHFVSKEGYEVTETGHSMQLHGVPGGSLTVTWPKVGTLKPYDQFRIAADMTVTWLFFFAAWSAFYMAMLAQGEALGAQRRAALAESAAQSAQIRALRYQVNPHFLFNTLNSLSSLVMTGRTDRAEAMLLALSTFFRTSLSLDASADVTLAQEIDLQRLYLDIENARFPDRLRVEIDVPAELEEARLPALILQPIVENAIKYGVATTRKTVLVKIVARPLGDGRMSVEVSNRLKNGGPDPLPAPTHEGTGVGLGNVCQRLEARFGRRAECRFGPMADGGYKVSLTMPIETRD